MGVSPTGLKAPSETSTVNLVQQPISASHLEIRCMSSLRKPVVDHLTPPPGSPFFFFATTLWCFLVYVSACLEFVSALEYEPQELRLFLPFSSLYLHCLKKCLVYRRPSINMQLSKLNLMNGEWMDG